MRHNVNFYSIAIFIFLQFIFSSYILPAVMGAAREIAAERIP